MKPSVSIRQQAGQRALDFYAGKTGIWELLDEFGESDDPDINELLDLVEHEPGAEGFWGVSVAEREAHMKQIEAVISLLLAAS